MPELNQPGEPERTAPDADDAAAADDAADAPISARDRWWWSAAVRIIVGAVVVGFQWDFLVGPDAFWLNWLVAGIGLALVINGLRLLARDYRDHHSAS